MAIVAPPTITPLPLAPDPNDRSTFDLRSYPFTAALAPHGSELSALAANVYGNATEAVTAAGVALASETSAIQKANAAAGSAAAAAASVGDYPKRNLGAKAANPTTDNEGQPLQVGTQYFNSTAKEMRTWDGAAWVAAYLPAGAYFQKSGGDLTGALNEARGASIPSAATLDLNAATGNFVHITGTNAVTAVTLAPGATRTVIFDGALTLAHSATLQLPGLANIVTAPGDRATFRGDSGGVVHCIYDRADGKALVGGGVPALGALLPASVFSNDTVQTDGSQTVRLSDTRAFTAGLGGGYTNIKVSVFDVNGTSVSRSTASSSGPYLDNSTTIYFYQPLVLDANRVLITYGAYDGGSGYVYLMAVIVTVAANGAISFGTFVTLRSVMGGGLGLALMGPNLVLGVTSDTGNGVFRQLLIDTSGAMPTLSSQSSTTMGSAGGYNGKFSLFKTSATTALTLYQINGSVYICDLTVSGAVVTATPFSQQATQFASFNANNYAAIAPDGDMVSAGYLAIPGNGNGNGAGVGQHRKSGVNYYGSANTLVASHPAGPRGLISVGACMVLAVAANGSGLISLVVLARQNAGDAFLPVSAKISVPAQQGQNAASMSRFDMVMLNANYILIIYNDASNSNYLTARLVEIGSTK